jgi:hypothetical protein
MIFNQAINLAALIKIPQMNLSTLAWSYKRKAGFISSVPSF